jgi:hypothetical protein
MRMSKQIRKGTPAGAPVGAPTSLRAVRRHPACILAILLGIFVVLSAPAYFTGAAQHASQAPATTSAATRSAALVAATQEVLKETSDVRQLPILRPVQSSTQSRAEIERAIIKNLDEETSPADLHASEVILKKLGLAPPDFQYRALMIRLLAEQVAGYYEPKTRQFHLADWIDVDGQKPIMAHELTHALQDQHFNLRRFEHWPKGDSDAELSAHALIEGDATLAMAMYVASNPFRALAFLKSLGATGIATEELDKAPRALRETLLFPYQEGLNWTRALYKQGGWKDVSQAFTTLPQSTEQILHADKYFAHEAPVKVTLPDVTNLLNASRQTTRGRWPVISGQRSSRMTHHLSLDPKPNPHPPGPWRRLASDVNGEWGFYLILDQFLKSPVESRRAAAGWAGDRFAVYENAKGEVVYVGLSTWDTENDAREFFDAYVKRTQLRYPDATTLDPILDASAPMASKSFRTSEGMVTVELHGSRVLFAEGVPGVPSLRAVLRALR